MLSNILRYVLTPVGIVVIFYLGGVLGFLTYGVALPRIEAITIKGLLLGSLMWPVVLVYDVIFEISNSFYSYSD